MDFNTEVMKTLNVGNLRLRLFILNHLNLTLYERKRQIEKHYMRFPMYFECTYFARIVLCCGVYNINQIDIITVGFKSS
jgi:hypothetical protein